MTTWRRCAIPFRWLIAIAMLWVPVLAAHARVVSFDYRCGSEIVLGSGAPADGWAHSATGRLGGKAGNPCWLRFDPATIAPRVLQITGADGHKSVTLFEASGKPLAVANDFGERDQAIVGSGNDQGHGMLFPLLPSNHDEVYARIDRDKFTVKLEAVALTAAIEGERRYDFLHFGVAVLYGLIALVSTALAITKRDRGQRLFAVYFAFLIVNELILSNVVVVVAPWMRFAPEIGTTFYPISQALETIIFAMLLQLRTRAPLLRWCCFGVAAAEILQLPLRFTDGPSTPVVETIDAVIGSSILIVYLCSSWRVWRLGHRIGLVMGVVTGLLVATWGLTSSTRCWRRSSSPSTRRPIYRVASSRRCLTRCSRWCSSEP